MSVNDKLHVFEFYCHRSAWFIARNRGESMAMFAKHYGYDSVKDFEKSEGHRVKVSQWPDDDEFHIYDGVDESTIKTRTCGKWAEIKGPGLLCVELD